MVGTKSLKNSLALYTKLKPGKDFAINVMNFLNATLVKAAALLKDFISTLREFSNTNKNITEKLRFLIASEEIHQLIRDMMATLNEWRQLLLKFNSILLAAYRHSLATFNQLLFLETKLALDELLKMHTVLDLLNKTHESHGVLLSLLAEDYHAIMASPLPDYDSSSLEESTKHMLAIAEELKSNDIPALVNRYEQNKALYESNYADFQKTLIDEEEAYFKKIQLAVEKNQAYRKQKAIIVFDPHSDSSSDEEQANTNTASPPEDTVEKTLYTQGMQLLAEYKPEEAEQVFNQLIQHAEQHTLPPYQLKALIGLAGCSYLRAIHTYRHDAASCPHYFQQAIERNAAALGFIQKSSLPHAVKKENIRAIHFETESCLQQLQEVNGYFTKRLDRQLQHHKQMQKERDAAFERLGKERWCQPKLIVSSYTIKREETLEEIQAMEALRPTLLAVKNNAEQLHQKVSEELKKNKKITGNQLSLFARKEQVASGRKIVELSKKDLDAKTHDINSALSPT